jgi:hypothetical protein
MPGTPASERRVSNEWHISIANPRPTSKPRKIQIWDEDRVAASARMVGNPETWMDPPVSLEYAIIRPGSNPSVAGAMIFHDASSGRVTQLRSSGDQRTLIGATLTFLLGQKITSGHACRSDSRQSLRGLYK